MRCLWIILLVCAVLMAFLTESEGRRARKRLSRHRRRLDEFAQMIVRTTDHNPMDFVGYGNWCGFGGSGETADAIDKCCMVHDKCYLHLNRHECKTFLKNKVYTKEYHWSMKDGIIKCESKDVCGKSLCECDRAAALCFGENIHVYNKANKRQGVIMSSLSKVLTMDWN